MRKLALDIEDLAVESFETGHQEDGGTVFGHSLDYTCGGETCDKCPAPPPQSGATKCHSWCAEEMTCLSRCFC